MSEPSWPQGRREFLRHLGLVSAMLSPTTSLLEGARAAASASSGSSAPGASAAALAADLHWLESNSKLVAGTTWGVPWPRGVLRAGRELALTREGGPNIPLQSWTLGYWPDGSVKWTGHAVAPGAGLAGNAKVEPGKNLPPASPIRVREEADVIVVETGVLTARLARQSNAPILDMVRQGPAGSRAALGRGRLICLLQDAPAPEDGGTLARREFWGEVQKVTIEQNGPVRAVVHFEGKHRDEAGREWLPFSLRLAFYAGSDAVRVMHSFVFDGDENRDFIAGLGLRFEVPMTGELHDRHIRFGGEGEGVWAEAVRNLSGLRRDPGKAFTTAQFEGKATPPLAELPANVRDNLQFIPAWADFSLTQLTPDGFAVRKRTKAGHPWIAAGGGGRAVGSVYAGGPTGGLALSLRDFWQRHPVSLEVRGAATETASLTAWFYSPEVPAMDLRFYHDGLGMDSFELQRRGLDITYEDYEPGLGSPLGVARSSELTLQLCPSTPSRADWVAFGQAGAVPPQLVCAPQRYLDCSVFAGLWSLPDKSTPARVQIENQLDHLFAFYQNQTRELRWYGFWDYGDVMHSYDGVRHVWRYDVGGYAWDNSELSPDLWLWYSFLRTGRADIFRFAEALGRHTGEVDVYHLGPYRGLGSRHNVQHWGDSSKQPRVSNAAYRRFYYFLTADERTGDLLKELLDGEDALTRIDIGRKLHPAAADPQVGHPEFPASMAFGTSWAPLAAAWLTAWERTGDPAWAEKLKGGMRAIASMPHGWFTGGAGYDPKTGHMEANNDGFNISHLSAVFGAVETNAELLQLLDVPAYRATWLLYCELYNAGPAAQKHAVGQSFHKLNLREAHSRLTAYAAREKADATLAARAWEEFYSGVAGLGVHTQFGTRRINGPDALESVTEGFGASTNAASQWGLAAIQNLGLVGQYLPVQAHPDAVTDTTGEAAEA